ncbi:MAG: polymer-forming cytoskeletal protein [Defluviitaleaceae bacterium]|nr:polymer-forming cytoskeletal protein [Defluviitaleaceae bacterium]
MFGQKNGKMINSAEVKTATIIAEGLTVKDNVLCGAGDVTISGVFFGDVDIDGFLIISDSGSVRGDVRAESAYVYGEVEGNVDVTGQAHIYSHGRIYGNIICGSLAVDEGAAFRGQCEMGERQNGNILRDSGKILKVQNKENLEYESELAT